MKTRLKNLREVGYKIIMVKVTKLKSQTKNKPNYPISPKTFSKANKTKQFKMTSKIK